MSVGTIHCQDTTGWHLATGVGERVLANCWHALSLTFLFEPARFGYRSRRGLFRTITEQLESDPVPLGASHIPSHILHHAAVAACVLNAPAPLGVTHHTNERARETSTTAPSYPLPIYSTHETGRAIANEPGFVSRVVVVVVSSVVCLGLLQKCQTVPGIVVGNKHTRHSGFVSMFRPWPGLGRSAFALHKTTKSACGRPPPSRAILWFGSSVEVEDPGPGN